jgi:hypothetical protein
MTASGAATAPACGNRPRAVRPLGARARRRARRGEDLAEQAGQLAPLRVSPLRRTVSASASSRCRSRSRPAARRSCAPRSPGRGSPPRRLDLVVRRVLQVLDVLGVSRQAAARGDGTAGRRAAAAPARAAASPAARAGGAATGRSPRATTPAGAAGWSARSRPCPARLSFCSASARLNSSRT